MQLKIHFKNGGIAFFGELMFFLLKLWKQNDLKFFKAEMSRFFRFFFARNVEQWADDDENQNLSRFS